MESFVKVLYLLSLVIWIGALLFFSLVVTPTVFAQFPRETAGPVVSALFPRYYFVGAIAGVVALAAGFFLKGEGRPWQLNLVFLGVMLAGQLYGGLVLEPRLRSLQEEARVTSQEGQPQPEEFRTVHRRAVILNAVVMLLGLVVVVITALYLRL